jgi:hypothetical protein
MFTPNIGVRLSHAERKRFTSDVAMGSMLTDPIAALPSSNSHWVQMWRLSALPSCREPHVLLALKAQIDEKLTLACRREDGQSRL